MRQFRLIHRSEISIGVMAEGVEFGDGSVAMRWCTPHNPGSTVVWASIADLKETHGQIPAIEFVWLDEGS